MSDESLSIRRYWREVLAETWKDTDLLSWRKALTTLGISALGFFLQWVIGVRAFYLTLQIIGTVIVAYILVAVISFAGNLIRAPVVRDSQSEQEIESLLAQLGKKISNEQLLGQLVRFSEEGHSQLQRCKMEFFEEWQTDADSWATNVAGYLDEMLGKPFGSRFRNSLSRSTLHQYSSHRHRALYDGLYVKIESLNKIIEGLQGAQSTFSIQPETSIKRESIKLLADEHIPQLLALSEEWSKLHDTFLQGVTGAADDQVKELSDKTEMFLRQELDDSHAAMVKNAPPEYPDLPGRAPRDKHFVGIAAAKLKKVNQIIEEQRRR